MWGPIDEDVYVLGCLRGCLRRWTESSRLMKFKCLPRGAHPMGMAQHAPTRHTNATAVRDQVYVDIYI